MSAMGGNGRYLVRRYGLSPVTWLGTNALAPLGPLLPLCRAGLDRPIFIVGCSRAGTTVFAELFGTHPDGASWMDASQVWDLHYYDKNGDDYRDERHATAWETARLRAVFGLYVRLLGKRRLINKNNQNALRLRLLDRVFPDCIVIHVIRDARPVVLSNVNRTQNDGYRRKFPFGRFPKPIRWREYVHQPLVDQFAHQWADITDYVRSQGTELFGPERYTEVRFEDFCTHPEYELALLDAFCGLGDQPGRDPALLARLDHGRSEGWRKALSPEQMARIRTIAEVQMTRLGYSWD